MQTRSRQRSKPSLRMHRASCGKRRTGDAHRKMNIETSLIACGVPTITLFFLRGVAVQAVAAALLLTRLLLLVGAKRILQAGGCRVLAQLLL